MTKKNKNLIYAGLLIGGLAYLFRKKKGTDLTVEKDLTVKDVKKQGGESQLPTEGGGATVETRGGGDMPDEVFYDGIDTFRA
jgi:LPXTG-motif cell wall-anchored protein